MYQFHLGEFKLYLWRPSIPVKLSAITLFDSTIKIMRSSLYICSTVAILTSLSVRQPNFRPMYCDYSTLRAGFTPITNVQVYSNILFFFVIERFKNWAWEMKIHACTV